ncbi:uncharacterized protein LOC143021746 [Oratosquilla oratoria]|uniref:uncharacterized protein LOC143021746 n=1 Tax=Oratosquilla oratoria TaxID=337810 RepID=UPI003F759AC2
MDVHVPFGHHSQTQKGVRMLPSASFILVKNGARTLYIKPIHYRNFDWSAAWSKFRRLEEHSEVESTDDENLGCSKRSKRSPKRYDPDSANIRRRGHSPSPPMPPLPHTNKYKRIRDQNVSDSEDEIDQSSDTTSLPLPPPPSPPQVTGQPLNAALSSCSKCVSPRLQYNSPRSSPVACSSQSNPMSPSFSGAGTRHSSVGLSDSALQARQSPVSISGNSDIERTTTATGVRNQNLYSALLPTLERIFTALEEIKAEQRLLKRLILRKSGSINESEPLPESTLPLDHYIRGRFLSREENG